MNQSSFDELVKRFENPEREKWQKPQDLVRFLGELKGKTVADLGAGTGYFSFRLAEKGATVIALDIDERFLEFIRKEQERRGVSGLAVRKTEPDGLRLNDGEVDLLLLVDVYHHIGNRVAFFKGAKTKLKPRGRIVIVDFRKGDLPVGPPDKHKLSSGEAEVELQQAGYATEVENNLLPYQYIVTARSR
ncbi:MAG: class I SAM-dependent methyltransferase [Leptospirales bacterium]|nr:class I SAM-dependent methyltransferase [Leptospirales bacterium]